MSSVLLLFCVFVILRHGTLSLTDRDPDFTHFTTKQCQLHNNCTYNEPGTSILVAIDGTGSKGFFESARLVSDGESGRATRKYRSHVGINHNQKWIWKSHVANFWEDYQGESHYFYGPTASEMIIAGNEVADIFNQAKHRICDFVHKHFQGANASEELRETTIHGEFGIDIIGFSRGGFAAMELARKLEFEGCGDIRPVFVRWLGLYDPVQRDIDWGDWFGDNYDNEYIGNNVLAVSVAERSEEIHSRHYFGYAVKGFDDPFGYPIYRDVKRFDASHAGVGGAPGCGDCCDDPAIWDFDALLCGSTYSVKLDKVNAVKIDRWMRKHAEEVNVPIKDEGEAYYGNFVEYFG
eukprot:CAMPEP_0202727372 /NCGR_PEP_ID=MMETSP1385-20130828/185090_1 /ASSEMBLY_ACC=CAM_ASM_000861 /TAXON_ID=933848 /ORGANISM="Elphidium margaritaceum" /LENGTH=349 /DNA_ID=CAMNT_0049393611 /DNA_START=20 /DNA_END=1069 /DNA_ORIENTATION=-